MGTDRKGKNTKARVEEIMDSDSTILSISPAAPDWNAVYHEDDGSVWFEPIACFALCERIDAETGKKHRFVGSMVSQDTNGLVVAEDANNFLGISPPEETEIEWVEVAAKKLGISVESEDDSDEDEESEDDSDELEEEELDEEEQVVEVVPRTRRRNLR